MACLFSGKHKFEMRLSLQNTVVAQSPFAVLDWLYMHKGSWQSNSLMHVGPMSGVLQQAVPASIQIQHSVAQQISAAHAV